MKCSVCGTEFGVSERFCPSCGALATRSKDYDKKVEEEIKAMPVEEIDYVAKNKYTIERVFIFILLACQVIAFFYIGIPYLIRLLNTTTGMTTEYVLLGCILVLLLGTFLVVLVNIFMYDNKIGFKLSIFSNILYLLLFLALDIVTVSNGGLFLNTVTNPFIYIFPIVYIVYLCVYKSYEKKHGNNE